MNRREQIGHSVRVVDRAFHWCCSMERNMRAHICPRCYVEGCLDDDGGVGGVSGRGAYVFVDGLNDGVVVYINEYQLC